jgi:hypothetical protein
MAQLLTTTVAGKVSATLAATDPTDLTRKQEVDGALATKAATVHTHTSAAITDLSASIVAAIGSWLGQVNGELDWQGLSGVLVRLAPSGGLLHAAGGLAVDPGAVSLPGHHHVSADVDDLSDVITALLVNAMEDSDTLQWSLAGKQLLFNATTGDIMFGGSTTDESHIVELITLAAGQSGVVPAQAVVAINSQGWDRITPVPGGVGFVGQIAFDGPTAQFIFTAMPVPCATQVAGQVKVASAGGLQASANGLAVDFGTGHTQAAYGDHTHDQLHDALTIAPSQSLQLALNGQELSAEAMVSTGGGLLLLSDGLALDMGTGHAQAARGDHTHDLSSLLTPDAGIEWVSNFFGDSSTIAWTAIPGDLTWNVRMDMSTGAGHAPLGLSGAGLYVALGTGPAQAAAGNHGHTAATSSAAGFMSATDKANLDALVNQAPLDFLPPLQLDNGTVTLPAASSSTGGYMSAADKLKLDALQILTFTAPLSQTGSVVSMAGVTATVDGYMHAAEFVALQALVAGTAPRATTAAWGFMDPADKVKLTALAAINSVSAPLALAGGVLSLPAAGASQNGYMSSADKSKLDSMTVISSVAAPLTLDSGELGIDLTGLTGGGGSISGVMFPLVLTDGILSLDQNFLLISGVVAPMVVTDGILSMPAATPTTDGYMSADDKANLDTLVGMNLSGGVINNTLEFAASLNPSLKFDAPSGGAWGIWATDTQLCFGTSPGSSPIFAVNNNNGIDVPSGSLNLAAPLNINGAQVVGYQQSAIADASVLAAYQNGGDPYYPTNSGAYGFSSRSQMQNFLGQVAGIISQLNLLLGAMRTHGLIAS